MRKYSFWACSLSEGDSLNKKVVFHSFLRTFAGSAHCTSFMFFRTGTLAGGNMPMAKALFLSRLLGSWATLFAIVGLLCAVVPLACHISLNQIGSIHIKKSLMMMVDRLQLVPRVWWQANQQLLPECHESHVKHQKT